MNQQVEIDSPSSYRTWGEISAIKHTAEMSDMNCTRKYWQRTMNMLR